MYAGWHFTADAAGCQSCSELIDLLLMSNEPCMRTLTLDDPSKVHAHHIFSSDETPRIEIATKLRLRSVPDQPALAETRFVETVFDATLGRQSLEGLGVSIRDTGAGKWDFSERYGDARVSFWRMVQEQ